MQILSIILLVIPAILCGEEKAEPKKSGLFDSFWPRPSAYSSPSATAAKLELEKTKTDAALNAAAETAAKGLEVKSAALDAERAAEAQRRSMAASRVYRGYSYSNNYGI